MTNQHTATPDQAAAWLLAEYDATTIDDLEFGDPPVNLQPMFTFKSVMHPSSGMHVTASDYHDPDRWWL